jgi:hypothetical protein
MCIWEEKSQWSLIDIKERVSKGKLHTTWHGVSLLPHSSQAIMTDIIRVNRVIRVNNTHYGKREKKEEPTTVAPVIDRDRQREREYTEPTTTTTRRAQNKDEYARKENGYKTKRNTRANYDLLSLLQ